MEPPIGYLAMSGSCIGIAKRFEEDKFRPARLPVRCFYFQITKRTRRFIRDIEEPWMRTTNLPALELCIAGSNGLSLTTGGSAADNYRAGYRTRFKDPLSKETVESYLFIERARTLRAPSVTDGCTCGKSAERQPAADRQRGGAGTVACLPISASL